MRYTLFTIICAFTFSITINAQTNLLTNGDFKADTTNLTAWPPTGWSFKDTHPALKTIFKDKFYIGVATGGNIVLGFDTISQLKNVIVQSQFSQISPENDLKWPSIEPKEGVYNYVKADAYVNFGLKNNMFIVGHTLIWKDTNDPDWVFVDTNGNPVTRQVLLARMKEHITSLVGRYKGKINGWDVVNEAINDDGTMRNTKYYSIIGPDFIDSAFVYAHSADPNAELYYNDYNLYNTRKLNTVLSIISRIRSLGVPVTAIGEQAHWTLTYPSISQVENEIKLITASGLKCNISEFDIDVLPVPTGTSPIPYNPSYDPYKNGLPNTVLVQLANRYGSLFSLFNKYRANIDRVTFWGIDDGGSWENNYPMLGRTNYPLLYDRNLHVKIPVLQAIEAAVK